MNCIDQHIAAKQFDLRTDLLRYCLPVLALFLFAGAIVATPTPATAGPQFSIPDLQSLQRKFQKRRRHNQDRQREYRDDEPQSWREDTLPGSPPPLPYRNPRFAQTQKFLGSLTLQEPEGQKRARKAEQVVRANTIRAKSNASSKSGTTENNFRAASKTSRSGITPTRWTRPQDNEPDRLREIPAPPRPAPPRSNEPTRNESPRIELPQPARIEERRSKDQLALILPSAPPLPIRKPRRHPSQIVEDDWSISVIESANQQCVTLGIEIKPLPPVKKGLCGNPAPILLPIIGVASVRPAATLSCPMAANLARWFSLSVQPLALKHFGKKVQQIRNVSSYVCRNRYGDTNTRISEHAYANALDIAHFELQGGEKVSVLKDWPAIEGEPSQKSAFLRAVHKSACEHFGTVLGPDANAAHKDHFHLDNAPRKRSNYCR